MYFLYRNAASDTEIVESRLLYEIDADESTRVAAEFLCHHGDGTAARSADAANGTPTIELRGLSNPDQVAAVEPVSNASQRRWLVRKAYIDRGSERPGLVTVDSWSVRSYVDYTCSAGKQRVMRLNVSNEVPQSAN
jgi:hypothetical protein